MTTWARTVRGLVGLVGVAAVLGGVMAFGAGEPIAGLWALVVGGVLIGVAVFEASRYRGSADRSERPAGFQPTDEVFVDPSTGARTRVWFDPRTGERRYEPER